MAGIFISYRRDDTAGHAGRLYDDLVTRFGQDQVFMDLETLRPGADYARELETAIASCEVVLVLIGQRWVSITDADGRRRLDNPDDVVGLEITTALNRDDIVVTPVLIGNARMPLESELPEPLRALRGRNAFELSDRRWNYDLETLVNRLALTVPMAVPSPADHGHPGDDARASHIDFRAWLEPEQVGGSGPERADLVIENLAAQPAMFDIAARRKDAGLDIEVSTTAVEIEARSRQSVKITLTPSSGDDSAQIPIASEHRALRFLLLVSPSDAPTAAREVAGAFILLPPMIGVRLDRREIESAGAATFGIRVENPGRRKVDVALEVEEHSGQCVLALDQSQLTVEPRAVAHAMLTVRPPDLHASEVRWTFEVRARPIAPPGPEALTEGTLIYSQPRLAIRLPTPEIEAIGPGVFAVEVENRGGSQIIVEMSAADATRSCTFAFDRPRTTIAPGAVAEFALTVTPPADHPPEVRWIFGVQATPVGHRAEPARAGGALIFRPPTVELSISPPSNSDRKMAKYEVLIRNPLDVPQTVRLDAGDRTGWLNVRWPERSTELMFEVPPGRTKTAQLEVSPVYRQEGREPLTLAFSVTATPIRPPGTTLSTQAQFVALPARRRRGRLLLTAVAALLGLIVLLPTGWPEILVVAVPLIGGIILRTRWWVVLYPAGLAIWLFASNALVTEVNASDDTGLSETLRKMNRDAPDDIKDLLTNGSTNLMTNRRDPCISGNLDGCDLTEWNIVALAAICALIGRVIGKLLRRFNARQ